MDFEHPYFLTLIPIFFLYFCYLWVRGKMNLTYLASPNVTVGKRKKLNVAQSILIRLPCIFLLLCFSFGAYALARPMGEEIREEEKIKAYEILLNVDVSRSMGGGPRVQDSSSIAQVVEFAKDFVISREGDVLGIVPFEGVVVEELVLPLTTSTDVVIKYLDDIKYYFGVSTAIGEAGFRSLIIFLKKALETNSDAFADINANNLNVDKIRRDIEEGTWNYGASIAKITGKIENAIVVILTDSGNNSGINPLEVMRYAHQLFGIKFYAVRIDVIKDKIFVEAVEETGGKAYLVANAGSTEAIFDEINRTERKDVTIGEIVSKRPLYRKYLIISLVFLCLYAMSTLIIKIP